MKKFLNIALTGLALLGLVSTASAQADLFTQTRTVVLAAPNTLSTIGTSLTTNGPIDVRGFDSKVLINVFSVTNAGNATITATFQTSDDTTNWVAIPNYAKAIPTTVSTTNYWGGYSNAVSQTALVPGVWTTPTAYSSGFATAYLTPASYTNSGAVDVAGKLYTQISYPVESGRQYLRVIWTQGGGTGATNVTVGATVTGPGNFQGW